MMSTRPETQLILKVRQKKYNIPKYDNFIFVWSVKKKILKYKCLVDNFANQNSIITQNCKHNKHMLNLGSKHMKASRDNKHAHHDRTNISAP